MDDAVLDGSGIDRARVTRFAHPVGLAGGIGWQLIVLDGDLDLCSSRLLAATLLAPVSHIGLDAGVVVDLTLVAFIDSSGLDALLVCRDHLRVSGRDLVVRNPSPMLVRMLAIFDDTDLAEQPDDRRECRFAC